MKINCVEEFTLPESNNFTPKFGYFNTNGKTTFFDNNNDDTAQMFEQVCFQRDNGILPGKSGQGEEDIWVTQEIKFSDTYGISAKE